MVCPWHIPTAIRSTRATSSGQKTQFDQDDDELEAEYEPETPPKSPGEAPGSPGDADDEREDQREPVPSVVIPYLQFGRLPPSPERERTPRRQSATEPEPTPSELGGDTLAPALARASAKPSRPRQQDPPAEDEVREEEEG